MTSLHSQLLCRQPLSIRAGGCSEAGKKQQNGDAFTLYQPNEADVTNIKGITACLADGASCSDNAQLASQTSVTHFINDYYSTPDSWHVKKSAAKVISALNSWLYHHQQFNIESNASLPHNKLLTTFSCIVFKSTSAHIFHVGDSRVYRIRHGNIEQLSRDHIFRQGKRSYLCKGLGLDQKLELDYLQEDLQQNDSFIICSDGFYDWCDLTRYKTRIEEDIIDSELELLAKEMVTEAFKNGSPDNASCVIIKVDHLPAANIDEAYEMINQLAIPPALDQGQKIDDYIVKDILYSGPRSHVYLVENLITKNLCVLKAPSQNFEEDLSYLEALMREEWVGRRLDHKNILKIYPRPANSLFLYHLSEYVEGITLRQWIYDNPKPSLDIVRTLTKAIITPLRAFQRHGIIHRDLKPENIMITPDGSIKLLDFGAVQVDGLDETTANHYCDQPMGAKDYMAPEYLQHGSSSHCSDIYSLGVIVYEMLVGELPYKSATQFLNHHQSDYIYAHKKRSDIPLSVDLALAKCCSRTPEYRYQSMSEFTHDLYIPNNSLIRQFEDYPLIKKKPLLFWKASTLLMSILSMTQWLLSSGSNG